MTRDEWLGMIQLFLEERMRDAPDEDCRALAEALFDTTAETPDAPGSK